MYETAHAYCCMQYFPERKRLLVEGRRKRDRTKEERAATPRKPDSDSIKREEERLDDRIEGQRGDPTEEKEEAAVSAILSFPSFIPFFYPSPPFTCCFLFLWNLVIWGSKPLSRLPNTAQWGVGKA